MKRSPMSRGRGFQPAVTDATRQALAQERKQRRSSQVAALIAMKDLPDRPRAIIRPAANDDAVVAVPKEVKARHGKRTPTVEEARWMSMLVEYCCVACRIQYGDSIRTPAEVHHILRGGQRIGHLFTLPLCTGHHRTGENGCTARHPWRKRFERLYGSELELLARLKTELGLFDKAEYSA